MRLTDVATDTPAVLASTGQQKALLIGVVLAHAGLIALARGVARCCCLMSRGSSGPGAASSAMERSHVDPAQTIVSGTDAETFLPLAGHAEAFTTGGGGLVPDGRFLRPESETAPVPSLR